jgi:hypothetical protein
MSKFTDEGRPEIDNVERHLPFVPCYKLTSIAAPLINHLKALMQVVQELDEDNASLRQQLASGNSEDGQIPSSRNETPRSQASNTVVLKSMTHS